MGLAIEGEPNHNSQISGPPESRIDAAGTLYGSLSLPEPQWLSIQHDQNVQLIAVERLSNGQEGKGNTLKKFQITSWTAEINVPY